MRIRNEEIKSAVLSLAVQGALAAMLAAPAMVYAAELSEEVLAIMRPTNFVEVGAENVSHKSAKFGEYNGLNKSGGDFIGNFSVRGGDGYGDSNGTMRWSLEGDDLGTTSRELGATVGSQGQWNLGVKYDELRHNMTDSYQTPFQGNMGGNSFTLPAGFGAAANTRTLSAGQQASLQTMDVGSTRKNTSLTAGFNIDRQWKIKFDYNHLDQTGAKLMSFGSDTHGGGGAGEAVSILPSPTNYKTDTVNLALSWVGDKGHMSASYFGSYFKDRYDRVTWTNWSTAANVTDTMSTPPSNDFHQLNLNGGYSIAAKTKLTGGISYGRNTQNDSFVTPDIMVTAAPVGSLNGVVVSSHADVKLTDQTIKNLALSAGIKYDKRDNRTASNTYNFNAIDGGNAANYPSTPLSTKKTQFELAGDYRLNQNQHVRLAFNHDDVKRWCNQYAVNAAYPAGTNCVVATASRDDKLSATYKLKASEDVNLDVGYAYSKRRTDFDTNAIAALISFRGDPSAGNTFVAGNVRGINGGDYLGFHPYFDASRKEQMVKGGVNWQANDNLSFGVMGRYTDDNYDTTYGVQNGTTWGLNLDATYAYTENGSVSAYLTQQHRQRDLTDLQRSIAQGAGAASATAIAIPAGASWTNKLKDDDVTVGFGLKQGGLMHGKLELAGDLTYSLGKTHYGTQLNYATTTSAPGLLTCAASSILSCGDLPDIKNATTQLKLAGTYQLDKSSRVALAYLYRRLHGDDYYYNGYQYGYTPNSLMATNQQSGSYSVNVVAASYIYSFK